MSDTPGMDAAAIQAFLREAFPHASLPDIEVADGRRAVCRVRFHDRQLRPGGTLSGPTMMALADTITYVLVLSAIGFEPLAVTTNLNINFLRKPAPADLLAEATLLKLGKTLAVADVRMTSVGEDELCAHAVVTYALPSKRS